MSSWALTAVSAVLVAITARALSTPAGRRRTGELLTFLFGVPAYAFLISVDLWAPRWNPLVGFPRNGAELLADAAALLRILIADGAAPPGATLLDLTPDGSLSAEPAKNAQISRLRLTFAPPGGGPPVSLRLFIKYQAERGTTLLARALGAAYAAYHPEVAFYTCILPALADASGEPLVPAPRCLAARYSRPFGRVLTVLETVGDEYEATPDWKVGRHQAEREAQATAECPPPPPPPSFPPVL